jgi:hypothetical protein
MKTIKRGHIEGDEKQRVNCVWRRGRFSCLIKSRTPTHTRKILQKSSAQQQQQQRAVKIFVYTSSHQFKFQLEMEISIFFSLRSLRAAASKLRTLRARVLESNENKSDAIKYVIFSSSSLSRFDNHRAAAAASISTVFSLS